MRQHRPPSWLLAALQLGSFCCCRGGSVSRGVSELLGSLGEARPGLEEITQRVRSKGYPFAVHNVSTADQVLLRLFRIPRPGAPPVLLQHGVLDSAWAWVFNENFKALAFRLHDAGYDVWLGNNRGNSFNELWSDGSTAHKSHRYWDFTYDDMAKFDLPAMIAEVVSVSGQQKLAYVGHSQGTLQFLIAGSSPKLKESVADHVSVFLALSPVAWLGHTRAFLVHTLAELRMVKALWLLFPYGFLDSVGWRHAAGVLCTATAGLICKISVDAACGTSDLDPAESVTGYAEHFPFGTSFKNMMHFGQAVRTGTFQAYDQGNFISNLKEYGHFEPPKYDLASMAVPTALLSAENDLLSDRRDVDRLIDALGPTGKLFYFKSYPRFSHVTWLLGSQEAAYYVDDVLNILRDRHPLPSEAIVERRRRRLEAAEGVFV